LTLLVRLTSVHLLLGLTLLGLVLAWLVPEPFVAASPALRWAFMVTMFLLGLVLPWQRFVEVARQPRALLLGVVGQYLIMPALGWLTTTVIELPLELRIGVLLVACVPGAMTSNVIVHLAGGPTSYSVALTTGSSLLAPVMTPLLFALLAGESVDVSIPEMLWQILSLMVIPLGAGVLLGGYMQRHRVVVERTTSLIASLCIAFICANGLAKSHGLLADASMPLFASLLLVNFGGYLGGWLWGAATKLGDDERFAFTIEAGMQNAGLGVVLASTHFPETGATLPCALYAFLCVLSASVLAPLLRRGRPHGEV
jgi:BASS family bile acid:Na+ symporter